MMAYTTHQQGKEFSMGCQPCQRFAREMGVWTANGMPFTPLAERMKRNKVCYECEHFKNPLCLKCGCVIFVKARLATSQCPEGKW